AVGVRVGRRAAVGVVRGDGRARRRRTAVRGELVPGVRYRAISGIVAGVARVVTQEETQGAGADRDQLRLGRTAADALEAHRRSPEVRRCRAGACAGHESVGARPLSARVALVALRTPGPPLAGRTLRPALVPAQL